MSNTNSASYQSKFDPKNIDYAAFSNSVHVKFATYKEEILLSEEPRKNANDQLIIAMQKYEKNPTEENSKSLTKAKEELESWDMSIHLYNFLFTETQQKIRFG